MAHLTPRLAGIDAVVNCVGILQGSLRDDAERVLRRRFAVSAETGVPTAYAQSTAKADAALARLDANWLIVKPSLVIGQGAYGGTALMRARAGLPFVLPLPGEGRELVHLGG